MRKINAIVDLDLVPLPESECSAGKIAKAINRNAGRFAESRNQISRSEMREVVLDVMRLRFDLDGVISLQRLLHRCRAPNIFNLLYHQLRMRPVGQDKAEPAQIIHAWFAIDRNVIDLLQP